MLAGVTLLQLKSHPDLRGDFTEIFRNGWLATSLPVQWNLSRSGPNVLRGMQVHVRHWDYICPLAGEMVAGLHDLRPHSPTSGLSVMMTLNSKRLHLLAIPPGVAHGFYAPEALIHLTGASQYYDPTDHRHCRWDCPELKFSWPCTAPVLSAADRDAPNYSALKADILVALGADQPAL